MAFNFDELLGQGSNAADAVIQNQNEINEVISHLESSLAHFLEVELQLVEVTAYEDDDKPQALRLVELYGGHRKKAGFNYLYLVDKKTKVQIELARLKHSNDGYPITVIFGKNHIQSDNQEDFASSLGIVISDPQTHLKLRKFKTDIGILPK